MQLSVSLLTLILPKHIYLRYFLLPLGDVFINAPPPLINGPGQSSGSTRLPPRFLLSAAVINIISILWEGVIWVVNHGPCAVGPEGAGATVVRV